MKQETLRVYYHNNPNLPEDCNHIGLKAHLTGQSYKEFINLDEAELFWMECGWPITQLHELSNHPQAKQINDVCMEEVEAQPDDIEEFIHSQRDMYELVDDVNFEEL